MIKAELNSSMLGALQLDRRLCHQNGYVTRMLDTTSKVLNIAPKFIVTQNFTHIFNILTANAASNRDENPMKVFSYRWFPRVIASEEMLNQYTYTLQDDIIPYLKASGRKIQLISRKTKSSFSSPVSNEVPLGDLLEFMDNSLSTLTKSIADLIPDADKHKDSIHLWNLEQTKLKDIVDLVGLLGIDTTLFDNSGDADFDESYYDFTTSVSSRRITNSISRGWSQSQRNANGDVNGNKGKDYIKKTLTCILENIYYYYALLLDLQYTYFVAAGALYDKQHDRHHSIVAAKKCIHRLSPIEEGFFSFRSTSRVGVTDERVSQVIHILGILWSTIDNVFRTCNTNINNIKSILGSHPGITEPTKKESIALLKDIENIFLLYTDISNHLYKAFMDGSPFENLINDLPKSNTLFDVYTPVINYLYEDLEKINDKLCQKIFHMLNSSIGLSRIDINLCPRANITKINATNTAAKYDFELQESTYVTILPAIAFPRGGAYSSHQIKGKCSPYYDDDYSFLDYWLNRAPKTLPVQLLDKHAPYDNTAIPETLILEKALGEKDEFTNESLCIHPLDFHVIVSKLFAVVPPGARCIEDLATKETSLMEKIGISLLYFGCVLTGIPEDAQWRTSAVPEFGLRVRG